jgi:tetratricopeptide (TPR) repeat protein
VEVREARRRLRAGDTAGALARLRPDDPLSAAEPERSWLLARILAERTDAGEARARVRALERSAFRVALLESLAEDPAAALARLRPWTSRSPWVSLAEAYLHYFLGDGDAAMRAAGRLRGCGIGFLEVEAHLVVARAALADGRFPLAEREAAAALAWDGTDARACGVAAEAARRAGRTAHAVANVQTAMRVAPEAEQYPRGLAETIRRDPDAEIVASLAAGPLGRPSPGRPRAEHDALAGLLAEVRGDGVTAVRLYERALAAGAHPIPVARDLRRLLFAQGNYERGLTLLLEAVPAAVRQDPRSLLADAWAEVERTGRAAPSRAADPSRRVAFARALVRVGALEDARSVLAGLEEPEPRAERARLEGQLALLADFEAYLEAGYRRGDAGGPPPTFAQVLAELGRLATRHLPPAEAAAFAEPSRGLRRVPLVGEWLDHATATTSPIVAHFRRYGLFVMLGRRGDQPPEAIVLSLASLTRGEEIRTRGGTYRQDVAVGYDRRLRSFATAQGGDLGGACLPDGIWLDLDSVRGVEHDLRTGILRDVGFVRAARRGPRLLAPDTPDGVFALTDPAGVAERLALRYVDRCPRDPWGSLRTLRAHEYGHLVEIRRHLPIARGLPASAALLAGSGFSVQGVEQEVERRAQLAAVAESADPDLALAELLLFLPVVLADPSPHEGGYRAAAGQIVRFVHARPDLFPEIDRAYRILPQLDRLSNEQIRRAARGVLPR